MCIHGLLAALAASFTTYRKFGFFD